MAVVVRSPAVTHVDAVEDQIGKLALSDKIDPMSEMLRKAVAGGSAHSTRKYDPLLPVALSAA